jgi:L-glyceraldehyde 3-phosphate reductase
VTEEKLVKVRKLNEIAKARGQSLAQMAVAWVLRRPEVTSALTGASKVAQVEELVAALAKPDFSADELKQIDAITA